ncbi:MAG: transcriptional repressor [Oscillospiraceae bacterium]|nr:transcriptional repressor [Oscillospiraceae bacterium]
MEMAAWPPGLKRTWQRELAWRILQEAERPMDAAALHRRMTAEAGPLAMSTVYRILGAFVESGMAVKTTMMGDETALYAPRQAGHAHYAICLKCHRQVPLKHCPLERLPIQETAEDFTITNHRLELYGYCKDCLKK